VQEPNLYRKAYMEKFEAVSRTLTVSLTGPHLCGGLCVVEGWLNGILPVAVPHVRNVDGICRTPADRDQRLVRGLGFQRVNFADTYHGVADDQKRRTPPRQLFGPHWPLGEHQGSGVRSYCPKRHFDVRQLQPEFAQHAARSITERERLQSRCVPDGLIEFCPSKTAGGLRPMRDPANTCAPHPSLRPTRWALRRIHGDSRFEVS